MPQIAVVFTTTAILVIIITFLSLLLPINEWNPICCWMMFFNYNKMLNYNYSFRRHESSAWFARFVFVVFVFCDFVVCDLALFGTIEKN
jgi:hypothetical protein